jgi:hypothetical protein
MSEHPRHTWIDDFAPDDVEAGPARIDYGAIAQSVILDEEDDEDDEDGDDWDDVKARLGMPS